MKARWLEAAVIGGAALVVAAIYLRPASRDCAAEKAELEVSVKAAEICTGTLVGCSLSYEQVRQLVADTRKAEACK